MTIKTFIEKAIKGGWDGHCNKDYMIEPFDISPLDKQMEFVKEHNLTSDIFINPQAWQAVGKVEGWKLKKLKKGYLRGIYFTKGVEIGYMHQMIDALADSKTIEEFIETL